MSHQEIRKKIGQMLMFGFSGTDFNDNSVRGLIQKQKIGGVILFSANILDAKQLRQLCQDLQMWNIEQGSEYPLFISIDQEGGRVSRIPWLVEQYPDPALLGSRGSIEDAFSFGCGLGKELSQLGITINLAPVLDVLSNPQNCLLARRCLASEAQMVADLGEALIKGLHAGGVLATGKHFPGHGDVEADSHLKLPVSNCDLDILQQRELIPFARCIQSGLEIIMTAHILYPKLDEKYPATLSRKIIQGLLRGQLGFQGLVMTDDLNMKAIANHHKPEKAAVLAARAGVDILLAGHNPDQQIQIQEALLAGYVDGEIQREIDQAYGRISRLKDKWQKLFALG